MKEKKQKANKKNVILAIIKKIKPSTLIIAILLLTFNSYAWFIYATKVEVGFTAHVTSWNVEFDVGQGEESSTNIVIDLERIYPGMEDYEKEIIVNNRGEVSAYLTYEISSIKVLGSVYEKGENVTSNDLENILRNNYPFQFNIIKEDSNLVSGTGTGSFKIMLSWPFESGNDELDTYWGNKAYEYYSLFPRQKSIEINLTLIANQSRD